MTFIEIVNKVLQRLREDTVSATSEDEYAQLIGDFVNETIREVEDAWDWNTLSNSLEITTEADIYRYTLLTTHYRTRIKSVWDYTNGRKLARIGPAEMNRLYMQDTTITSSEPRYWSLNDTDELGRWTMDVYPPPENAGETWYVHYIDTNDTITSDTTDVPHPSQIIILGAYAKAIQERGEDMGTNLVHAQRSYENALSDYIAIDARNTVTEVDWRY